MFNTPRKLGSLRDDDGPLKMRMDLATSEEEKWCQKRRRRRQRRKRFLKRKFGEKDVKKMTSVVGRIFNISQQHQPEEVQMSRSREGRIWAGPERFKTISTRNSGFVFLDHNNTWKVSCVGLLDHDDVGVVDWVDAEGDTVRWTWSETVERGSKQNL